MSGIGTLTEGLSGFVDSLLNPLLCNIPSYLQDTTHFLNVLNNITVLNDQSLLVTMDVTSLYTNIPHNEGVLACKKFFIEHGNNQFPADDLEKVMHFILTNNYFSFNSKHYLQVQGTAMGTKMAPSYANIFMAYLEKDMLSSFHLKPTHFLRYIDDVFFIWEHGEDSLRDFERHVNNFHHSIKFTTESSYTLISFLDVLVKLKWSDFHFCILQTH